MSAVPIDSTERWNPVDAPVRGSPAVRSPAVLRAVVAQFDVAGNPRYQPGRPGVTWCNILIWDVTRALGCEVPHWVDVAGRPVDPGDGEELTANAIQEWLTGGPGRARGWMEVVEAAAGERAARGFPTIAVWRNPNGGHGHIAILLPPRAGDLRIAQAGRHCLYDARLPVGFGAVQPIRFFTHD